MKKVVRQLLKEFWAPLAIALFWMSFNIYSEQKENRSIRVAINAFAAAFFLASWAISQWYRIRKQQAVDQGLIDIKNRLVTLVAQLESKTSDTISFITGGNSICYITGNIGTQRHPFQVDPVLVWHHGKYPLYEIKIRITDLDKSSKLAGTGAWIERMSEWETYARLDSLVPGHAANIEVVMPVSSDSMSRNFNIFFTARNGSFTQLLRFRKINGLWLRALKVEMGEVMYEEITEGYPRDENGKMDWESLQ